MSATIHHLPPRYRVYYHIDDERQGYVVDEATGRDWDTRSIDCAVEMLEHLKLYFREITFWIVRGDMDDTFTTVRAAE